MNLREKIAITTLATATGFLSSVLYNDNFVHDLNPDKFTTDIYARSLLLKTADDQSLMKTSPHLLKGKGDGEKQEIGYLFAKSVENNTEDNTTCLTYRFFTSAAKFTNTSEPMAIEYVGKETDMRTVCVSNDGISAPTPHGV